MGGTNFTLDTAVWDTFVKLCHAYAIIADSKSIESTSKISGFTKTIVVDCSLKQLKRYNAHSISPQFKLVMLDHFSSRHSTTRPSDSLAIAGSINNSRCPFILKGKTCVSGSVAPTGLTMAIISESVKSTNSETNSS